LVLKEHIQENLEFEEKLKFWISIGRSLASEENRKSSDSEEDRRL